MTERLSKPSCFIAMPITVHSDEVALYGDDEHWDHVMRHLFIPAIKKAGFDPVIPTAAGTSMIHGRIVKHLSEADLVLVDLSKHNPNVLFELGVRTSLNRPVALVKDEHLNLPFDIQGLNTFSYSSKLQPWSIEVQVENLAKHITDSVEASGTTNPLWEHFGVSISASQPPQSADPRDATLQLILERMEGLERTVRVPPGTQARPQSQISEMIMEAVSEVKGIESLEVEGTVHGATDIRVTTRKTNGLEQDARVQKLLAGLTTKRFAAQLMSSGPEQISLVLIDTFYGKRPGDQTPAGTWDS